MAMGFNAQYERTQVAGADLNSATDTVLLSRYFPSGGFIRRLSVVAETSNGLLAPSELRISVSTDGGANYTNVTNDDGSAAILDVASARARGVLVYKDLGITVAPGSLVAVRVKAAAGGTSTARVILEHADEPWNGSSKLSTAVEGTGNPV